MAMQRIEHYSLMLDEARDELQSVTGLSRQQINDIELGYRRASRKQLETLLRHLDLEEEDVRQFADAVRQLAGGYMSKSGINIQNNQITVINGALVVEGHQFNINSSNKNEILDAIVAVVEQGLRGADISPIVETLANEMEKQGITQEEISSAITSSFNSATNEPSKRQQMNELIDSLTVGASSSILATAIIETLKFLLCGR